VKVRKDVSDALSQPKLSELQRGIEPLAERMFAELPRDRPVDLVSEVLRPWSLAVTTIVLALDATAARRLSALQTRLAPGNSDLRAPRRSLKRVWPAVQRRIAIAGLNRFLLNLRMPGAQSLFRGLSQTLPDFLATAWLALLEHPSQFLRLRAEPHLVPKGVEELLRYAGPVHTLVREADRTVELAGIKIAGGQRVILKLASANRDPQQFFDPDSLDITRNEVGHLALGGGSHSCIGASMVRVASVSATRAFAGKLADAELIYPIMWRSGSTLDSPASLWIK
jgi:cytochrome P450